MAFATDRLFSEYIYVPSYTTSTSISANISITKKINFCVLWQFGRGK